MGPRLPGDRGPTARPDKPKNLTHNPFAALAAKVEAGRAEEASHEAPPAAAAPEAAPPPPPPPEAVQAEAPAQAPAPEAAPDSPAAPGVEPTP
jgi:3'-5' exoribonuclease